MGQGGQLLQGMGGCYYVSHSTFNSMRLNKSQETEVLSVLCCQEMPLKLTDKVFGIFSIHVPVLGDQYLQAPLFPERGSSGVRAEGWE